MPPTQNITMKIVKSKICPPSATDSLRKFCRNPSSRNTKSFAHNSSPPKMLSSCSMVRSSSLKRSRLPSQIARPSNMTTGVPKTATRVFDNQNQKPAKPTIVKNDKLKNVNSIRTMSASKNREPDSAAVDLIRKIFSDRLEVKLSDDLDTLAGELADGVHLCGLMNSFRPRTITSMFTSSGTVLSSPKAKRNVDSFIAACRKLGVPEVSICSSADILNKRNITSVTKTVLALQ
ncbi:hypothetical protein Angca_002978, partial [Angiostrongylus cantonensis]